MLVYIDPATRRVVHTQSHHPVGHADAMRALGETVIELDEPMEIEEIEVTPYGSVFRRGLMQIEAPASIPLGETAVIINIPDGASVTIEGNDFTMEDTTLELEPNVAGTYRLRFTAYGFVPKEISIEVVDQSQS